MSRDSAALASAQSLTRAAEEMRRKGREVVHTEHVRADTNAVKALEAKVSSLDRQVSDLVEALRGVAAIATSAQERSKRIDDTIAAMARILPKDERT